MSCPDFFYQDIGLTADVCSVNHALIPILAYRGFDRVGMENDLKNLKKIREGNKLLPSEAFPPS